MNTVTDNTIANTTEIFEIYPEGVPNYIPQEDDDAFMLSGDYAELAADLSSLVY